MPTISEFYGIQILMRYLEHNPPHFHAKYQNYQITVEISNGKINGEMPERGLRFILEWLEIHREELLQAWENATNGEIPAKIEPLK